MGGRIRLVGGKDIQEGVRDSKRDQAEIVPPIGGKVERQRRGKNLLTDRAVSAWIRGGMKGSLRDGGSLYLASGARVWRIDYRHGGKEHGRRENTYTVGRYGAGEGEFSIAGARKERDKVRAWLDAGKDPNIEKRAEKARAITRQGEQFEKLGREFLELKSAAWSRDHAEARRRLFERDLEPALGVLPLTDLESSPAAALAALKRIEQRGAHEVAAKARILGSMICRYGIVTGRMKHDPFEHLGDALKRPPVINRATIPLAEMPTLFEALAKVPAEANTRLALYWLMLTATRTSEMRFAVWTEIDAKPELWRIPAARMKMREPHVVPLSKQALRVLELARPLRQSDERDALIFPGFTKAGHLSENALLALLARAGFYGRQTSHGFRATFSTWAHETHEADPDVVEACLAHVKEGVRGIYNRASYLSRRRELLQAWADQCSAWGFRLP